ncbi:MAG: SDR family NAD(P)-dependent oxidoreductase [Acidimicrobiales bacterium]
MRLEGKVAIITGAGQGIGKAYADRFLEEGAKVAIAEVSEERGEGALAELKDKGEVVLVRTDISDEDSAQACAKQVKADLGGVDILVNNAALYYDIDNANNSYDYLQKVFSVNLHGAWLMTRAVAPYMAEQHWGRVINQSSGAAYIYLQPPMGDDDAFHGVPAFSYSQTKWGVVGLTKFLAGALGKHGITVNCIAPGVTMTEATKKIVPEDMMGMITFMTALRTTLEPEDITGTAVFFASDDAKMITGQVLCVDAGMSMPA